MSSRINLRRLVQVVLLLMVATFVVGSTNIGVADAKTAGKGKKVSGQFITQQFSGAGCASPIGICSSGTATGDLAGKVDVVILTAGNAVDAAGNPLFVYTANITITDNKTVLSGTIAGQVVVTTGQLTSVVTFTNGTRKWKKFTGTLNVTGTFNFATGAELDNYSGRLFKTKPGVADAEDENED